MKRIILAGGSGFLGNALAQQFLQRGDEVLVLTRRPSVRRDGVKEVAWDARSLGNWEQFVDGADAVVNLTGKNINCVFTPENRRLIIESRVNATRAIAEAIQRAATPPRVLIQASAIGFYGDTGDAVCDETSPAGSGFLAEACRAWEAALDPAALPATRCVVLRFGMVLGRDGGALQPLARLTKLCLGGATGDGRQFISWVHLEDLKAVVATALANENWRGPFNVTAPNPVTNAEFMRELRRVFDRPWSPPAPAFAVRLLAPLLGVDASLALEGQRVLPQRLQAAGFEFQFPELRKALQEIARRLKYS
ncbi:MAG: TIGR01777 family oxidoreductase [Verrucomicrobia bacterium]|nr:TIGR01777 family oxidoreductase [Verrucomicrobiota bacterium]